MALIPALVVFAPGTKIKSAEANSNFDAIKTAFNTSAVLTDVARTINVAHTFNNDILFTDASFDIGKTGATRPRDGFFSRNVTAGAAFLGNLTGNVTGNVTGNLTGTVLTASQPNITSLGSLTGLTVTGQINANGNIVMPNNVFMYGNSTGAVAKALIGVDAANKVNIDAQALGVVLGGALNVAGTITPSGSITTANANGYTLAVITADQLTLGEITGAAPYQLLIGMNTISKIASIQAIHQTVGYTQLNINPAGGLVTFGAGPIAFSSAVTGIVSLGVSAPASAIATFNTTGGATSDNIQIFFQRAGVTKWRLGTNIDGTNADRWILYSDAIGNVISANQTTGVVSAPFGFSGNLTGTILTAAQANITSLGTLTGLTISGLLVHDSTAPTYQFRVSGINKFAMGVNVNLGGNPFEVYNYAAAASGFSLSAGNVFSAPGGITANVTGNVTGNLTGTILTAAQANITSLGTLTSLAVSGALSAGATTVTSLIGLVVTTLGAPSANTATLATIGGAGSPVATQAQAKWLPITGSDGLVYYVPGWR